MKYSAQIFAAWPGNVVEMLRLLRVSRRGPSPAQWLAAHGPWH